MSLLVLFLIVAGAVAHATWNLEVKRVAISGPAFVWLSSAGAALFLLPVAVVAWILDPPNLLHLAIGAVVSGAIHAAYFLLLQRGYREGDVSVVYPLARGTGPLLAVGAAILFLGETPTWLGLAGALAVVAGVVVIGFWGGRANWSKARAGVFWGLLTGVAIAAYTVWDGHAVTEWAIAPVILSCATFAFEVVALTPVVRRAKADLRGSLRKYWRSLVIVCVLSPLSYVLILWAMQLAPVSIVAPAREVSVVLVGLAGWLWFKEPHPARRLIGAAVVLVGVGLLAVSR